MFACQRKSQLETAKRKFQVVKVSSFKEFEVSAKKKILFVAYGGGHVNMVLPVIQSLTGQGRWDVEVLGLTTAGIVLSRAGIAHLGFKDIVGSDDGAALEWGERLIEGLPAGPVSREETVAYLGLSYANLEADYGVEGAARIYAEKGRHVFLPVGTLKRFLQRIRPNLVVATNAPRGERAAILAARDMGIPAVCLVDLYPPQNGEWLKENWYGQKICVLNRTAKEMLVRCGRDPKQVESTGNPAFDRHYLFAGPGIAALSAAGKIVVGYASNIIPGEVDDGIQRAAFEQLRKLCQDKNYELALRQHPNETPWTDIEGVIDCREMSLEQYLSSLDMLVTFPSTIALEAQIHGVRVVLLDLTVLSVGCPYLFNGDFEAIRRLQDIHLLTVESADRDRKAEFQPGSATEKVCEVILQVLENTID